MADCDPALAAALADAAQGSDLDAENQRLRALLIALHAWAESEHTQQAHELLAAIWAELRESTVRRVLSMGQA